jgi:iron complex outermembrane receptor protein
MKKKILLTPIALVASLMVSGAYAADVVLPEVRVTDTSTMINSRDLPATTESVTAEQIADSINVINTEDALKYLPSLNVRKRFEGDRNGILATRTSGTLQSAKSVVYGDGVLLSVLLGNSFSYPPRWFMVAPEEIERIDVTYGPFSALYPGNAAGAAVNITTRMPKSFEAHTRVQAYNERFSLFGTQANYTGNQQSATVGDRKDQFSWWFGYNRSDTQGHPASFTTLEPRSSGGAGVAVTGGHRYIDHTGRSQIAAGGYAIDSSLQENFKTKFSYDLSNSLSLSYTFAALRNDASTSVQSYLFDASGNAVYGAANNRINIGGTQYTLSGTHLTPTKTDQEHHMHALAFREQSGDTFDWELITSLYDYQKDLQKAPTSYLGTTDVLAAGRNTNMKGTGWHTFDAKGIWRPGNYAGLHKVIFGYHYDQYELQSLRMNTANWAVGNETGVRNDYSAGKTSTQALFIQDQWGFAKHWSLTPGLRYEEWRAFDGKKSLTTTSDYAYPERKENFISPKLSISYAGIQSLNTRLSWGRGYRMPTVTELFQGTPQVSGDPVAFNPNLKPERDDSTELTFEKSYDQAFARLSLFEERANDAIWSQTATAGTLNGTASLQNIDLVRTRGVEVAAQTENLLIKGLSILGSVTYADSVILKNSSRPSTVGNYQPRVPLWRGTMLASYSPDQHWIYSLGAKYSGKMTSSLDSTSFDQRAYGGVSKFFILDAKVKYKFDKQWSSSLGINNLNNYKSYVVHPNSQRTVMADLKYDIK